MKNLLILFFLMYYLLCKSQIKDLSIYYSAMPHSKTYHLMSLQDINVQANFISKNKLNFGVFAFYGANQESYNGHWLYNPGATQKFGELTLKYSYQGSQLGLGVAFYYELIKRKRFIFSPGVKPSVSYFTKAHAVYNTIYVEHGVTDTVETVHTTDNYLHIRDSQPSVFSMNFVIKCEFSITKRLTLLTEPFITLIRWHKIYAHTLFNAGGNIGLTWKLGKQTPK